MAARPRTRRSLADAINEDRQQIRRQVNTSPFFNTGMHPNGLGGMDSDNYAAGVSGYRFSDDGNAEFNDLTLRGGIIGNDALTEPVVPDGKYASTSGFGITFAGAFVATLTQTIPSGCTGCIVTAAGSVLGQNSTASSDQLYTSIGINGGFPAQFPTGVGPGTGNTSTRSRTSYLTGLTPGGTLTVGIYASTGVASWAASPNNAAEISATFLFLR